MNSSRFVLYIAGTLTISNSWEFRRYCTGIADRDAPRPPLGIIVRQPPVSFRD